MLSYIIGDSNMVTGFRLVGIEGTEVSSVDQASQALNNILSRKDLAIIIISEEYSTQPPLNQIIEKLRTERKEMLIVQVPGSKGKPSQTRMSDLISKTLGVKI